MAFARALRLLPSAAATRRAVHDTTITAMTRRATTSSGRPISQPRRHGLHARPPVSALTMMPTTNTTTAPIRLCQRNAMLTSNAHVADDRHAGDQADEGAGAVGARPADGQQEHAEDRAVEERAEAVHHFDQRAELGRPDRDDRREHRPEHRSPAVDTLRSCGSLAVVRTEAAVEVDHRRRRQRRQLRRDRRHRRGEDRGHQQADQADRQVRHDVGREDVVDVVVACGRPTRPARARPPRRAPA